MPAQDPQKPPRNPTGPSPGGQAESLGKKFEALVELQARLRSAEGCPWDREQTHASLKTFLLEETYEVLEAIDAADAARLSDELGDLLLQIVFHAQLAREEGQFEIGEVIDGIHAKMVRRHPHVFGQARADDAREVLRSWEHLKAEERRPEAPGSVLEGVSPTLPALCEAYQLTRRAANIGFDWENIEGLLEKLREEVAELRQVLATSERTAAAAAVEEEVGDLLFVVANVARFLGLDPELALKKANRKFLARFQRMEAEMAARGRRLAEASREEMEQLWGRSKNQGPKPA